MLLILISILTLFIGILLASRKDEYGDLRLSSGICIMLGGILVFFCCMFMLINRTTIASDLLKLEVLRKTYESDQLRGQYDRSAILLKVAEANSNLASDKYYADNIWFNWFWPDAVREAKPIEQ